MCFKKQPTKEQNTEEYCSVYYLYDLALCNSLHKEWDPIVLSYVVCKSQQTLLVQMKINQVAQNKIDLYLYTYNYISVDYITKILNDVDLNRFNAVSSTFNSIVSSPFYPQTEQQALINKNYLEHLKASKRQNESLELTEEELSAIGKIDDTSISYLSTNMELIVHTVINASRSLKRQYKSFLDIIKHLSR